MIPTRMPNRFADEISDARNRLGITQEEAARRAGVPLRSYQGYERGENEPRAKRAEAIRQALRLASNTSTTLATPGASSVPQRINRADSLAKRLREETTLTLYTHVAAAPSAADGAIVFDEASRLSVTLPRIICRQWLGFDPPDVMGVSEVTGDSMEPLLHDGDLVLYALTPEVNGGGLFVVNYDGRMLCKRVQQLGSVYRLIPENRMAGYVAESIRATGEGYVHEDTDDEIGFAVVGKILWPNQHTSRLHMQQVGDLLRRMFREASEGQPL